LSFIILFYLRSSEGVGIFKGFWEQVRNISAAKSKQAKSIACLCDTNPEKLSYSVF